MIENCTATVFGGTGFLGRAVVQALAKRGYIVRVPTRDVEKAKYLKQLGQVGQIVPLLVSVRSDASAAQAIAGSSVVINLIGILAEKGKDTFQTAHVETAARLARIARASGVKHFLHVSALGADMKATARYARSKAVGEEAVRAFFPKAVIFRPSVLFGPGDSFIERFARLARFSPVLPLIGGGATRFQPVYVGDVAAALMACLDRPETAGRFFALGGPKIYTFKELMQLIFAHLGVRRFLIGVPWSLAMLMAFFAERLPVPPLTRDQVELLKTDSVIGARRHLGPRVSTLGSLESLGLPPTPLESILPNYVRAL